MTVEYMFWDFWINSYLNGFDILISKFYFVLGYWEGDYVGMGEAAGNIFGDLTGFWLGEPIYEDEDDEDCWSWWGCDDEEWDDEDWDDDEWDTPFLDWIGDRIDAWRDYFDIDIDDY